MRTVEERGGGGDMRIVREKSTGVKGLIIGIIGASSLLVLGLIAVLMYVGYSNAEVRLRNQIVAKQRANEASFDTCWKIIKQQAQVADQYKDGFKEIYTGLMEGQWRNEKIRYKFRSRQQRFNMP